MRMTDLDRAIELRPNDGHSLAVRGEVHRLQGRLEQARIDLDKAIELNANDAFAWAHRGEVHRLQGRLDQAMTDFDEAIRLRPKYASALANTQRIIAHAMASGAGTRRRNLGRKRAAASPTTPLDGEDSKMRRTRQRSHRKHRSGLGSTIDSSLFMPGENMQPQSLLLWMYKSTKVKKERPRLG